MPSLSAQRHRGNYVKYYTAVRNRDPFGHVSWSRHTRGRTVGMHRDHDVIIQANRRVDEMQDAVATNRALIERTRVLIAHIGRLLSGSGGSSTPAQ